MPKYVTEDEVKNRLLGKVQFTDVETDQNKMQVKLLKQLIDQAESEVELDLSPRYDAPFQGVNGEAFKTLPSLTLNIIKTLCQLQAVMRVLDTDYGRGSITEASKYYESMKKRYDNIVMERLLKKKNDKEDTQQYLYPPLPGLRLGYFNTAADDGFAGTVISFSPSGDGAYPADQINDPSESFFRIYGQGE